MNSGNCHFILFLKVGEDIATILGTILIPCYHCNTINSTKGLEEGGRESGRVRTKKRGLMIL